MQLKTSAFLQGGKYLVIRTLGQGGFGITYEAEQVALHRRVAIKEFFMKDYCERDSSTSHVSLGTSGSQDLVAKFKDKFVREAQMIASLDHPNIVKIHDIFEENGTAYYVMEFLEGGSLADLVKKSGPLPEAQAIEYIRQVGDALSILHAHNYLHFDVKPSNVLLNRAGKAVLIDFGISKHYDETGSQTSSTPVGVSKGYAPLEQYQQTEVSSFTPATDIYALGATLYFLLTGQTPPGASEVYEDGLASFPTGISKTFQDAIIKAMSPRRKDRPQTVKQFFDIVQLGDSNDIHSFEEAEKTTVIGPALTTKDNALLANNDSKQSKGMGLKESPRHLRYWLLMLLGVALVFMAVVLLQKYSRKPSSIHIDSDPSSAEIWIDDNYTMKRTPADIEGLIVGEHKLVIKKTGYNDFKTSFTIKRGENSPVYLGLHKQITTSSIMIKSNPSGASIIIDGVATDFSTPHLVSGLQFGQHDIRLKKDGYRDSYASTNVSPGGLGEVELILTKL